MPFNSSGDYYTDFNPCVFQRFEVAPLGRKIDPYFGATVGPLEREEVPLNPLETARRQICSRQIRLPDTRTAGNWRDVDEAVSGKYKTSIQLKLLKTSNFVEQGREAQLQTAGHCTSARQNIMLLRQHVRLLWVI